MKALKIIGTVLVGLMALVLVLGLVAPPKPLAPNSPLSSMHLPTSCFPTYNIMPSSRPGHRGMN